MAQRPATISQSDLCRLIRAARKEGARAVKLAEAGATVPELCAIFGWSDAKMAMLYVRQADRARLARQGMGRLKK